ncbi:MAG TPA: NADPH-dependent FMN reductase [Dongiaceae bacterium]|jgi:NAD(P)H-dependent FMN reductase|nr:NADPH-dependent FMN reductase [Dongiaceae bacterium]
MKILAISGSLRAVSANTAALQATRVLVPAGHEVILYEELGRLPHFNPDLDDENPPEQVRALRALVGDCGAILISSPEYAHGIPGSLKNALDWLVGSTEFPGKPVALVNTSPRGFHAQAALREVLTTMAADLIESAFVTLPLLGRSLSAEQILADPALSAPLSDSIASLISAVTHAQPV